MPRALRAPVVQLHVREIRPLSSNGIVRQRRLASPTVGEHEVTHLLFLAHSGPYGEETSKVLRLCVQEDVMLKRGIFAASIALLAIIANGNAQEITHPHFEDYPDDLRAALEIRDSFLRAIPPSAATRMSLE